MARLYLERPMALGQSRLSIRLDRVHCSLLHPSLSKVFSI